MTRLKIVLALVVGALALGAYVMLLRPKESSRAAAPEDEAQAPSAAQIEAFLREQRKNRPDSPPPPPPPTQPLVRLARSPKSRPSPPSAPPKPPKPHPRERELQLLASTSSLHAFERRLETGSPAAPAVPTGSITSRIPARTILAGTLGQAQLLEAVNTDEPGPVRALLTDPVFDRTGRVELLPAGTQAFGTVLPVSTDGYQKAAQIEWGRLITPGGWSIELGEPAGSTDANGGFLDGRIRRRGGSKALAILVSALTAGGIEAAKPSEAVTVDVSAAATATGTRSVEELVTRWAQRVLQRPATVHLQAGDRIVLRFQEDLTLSGGAR